MATCEEQAFAYQQENVEVVKSCVERAKAKKNAVCLMTECANGSVSDCRPRSRVSGNHISEMERLCADTSPGWRMFWRAMSSGQSTMPQWFWRNTEGTLRSSLLIDANLRENKLFMGLSFETISSTGANAGELQSVRPAQVSYNTLCSAEKWQRNDRSGQDVPV